LKIEIKIVDKYSMVRIIVKGLWILFAILSIGFMFCPIPIVKAISFVLMFPLSISMFFIRCELCRGLIYRKGHKEHGLPVYDWHRIDANCPNCGLRRIGLFEWLGKKTIETKQ